MLSSSILSSAILRYVPTILALLKIRVEQLSPFFCEALQYLFRLSYRKNQRFRICSVLFQYYALNNEIVQISSNIFIRWESNFVSLFSFCCALMPYIVFVSYYFGGNEVLVLGNQRLPYN